MTPSGAREPDAGPGPLLTAGTTADIYLLDEHRLLRRYREHHDLAREASIMRHLAEHGFPVPRVDSAEGLDLVMEQVHGPTLLQALAADEVSIADGAHRLAQLHDRLHAVPPLPGADDAVVHLALHPGNVILSEPRGAVLIDWTNARTGPADLDVAMTGVIVGEVAVDEDDPDYARGARAFLAAFLAAADGDPVPHLEEAVRIRLGDASLVPGERALVRPAADLVRHFRAH